MQSFDRGVYFLKQKTAYEMCGRDWSSDVCSSDLVTVSRYTRAHPVPGTAWRLVPSSARSASARVRDRKSVV